MVTVSKTWTSTLNVDLGSSDQGVQYQVILREWVNQLTSAGWAVTRCSDSVSVGTTNLWLANSNVVWGSAAQARSWIVLSAPTTWGSPSAGLRFHLLIDCTNTAPDTTPQSIYISLGTLNFSGSGTTTARPTIAAGGVERVTSSHNILNWATPSAGRAHFWRTSNGDVYVFSKLTTDAAMTSGVLLVDPGANARGANRATYWVGVGTLSRPASGWNVFALDASTTSGSAQLVSPADLGDSWVSGLDASGEIGLFPGYLGLDTNVANLSRYLGYLPDVWFMSGSNTALFNFVDPSDTDPTVLRGFNQMALPVPSGAPALQ